MSKFAKVPISAIADNRLTPRQFKVLCALFLFADSDGKCHPKKTQISDACGIANNHISVTTAQLAELGWLEKSGNGGRSSSMDYTLKTSPDSGLVKPAKPVPKQYPLEKLNQSRFRTKTSPDSGLAPSPDLGLGIQQTISTDQQQTSKRVANHDSPPAADIAISAKAKTSPLPPAFQEACRKVWTSYATAYQSRYGVEPVRNAKVNRNVIDLVKRLGFDESPLVAAFYLTHSGGFYVRTAHSMSSLLSDAEKLRMEWVTGRRVTATSALHEDKRQAAVATVGQYAQSLEGRYEN